MTRSKVILLVIPLLLAGCGRASVQDVAHLPAPTPDATLLATASATPARDSLAGTTWFLFSLYGEPPLEGTRITLAFSGGFVRGFAGCNKYDRLVIGDNVAQGKYKATEEGSLAIPGLAITALACPTPEGVMEQEDAYLEALRGAVAYRLVSDRLEIDDAAGETILVFTSRPEWPMNPANLQGAAWQLASIDKSPRRRYVHTVARLTSLCAICARGEGK